MQTITLATNHGPQFIKPTWKGHNLAVHRPIKAGGALSTEPRCWQLTHIATGHAISQPLNASIDLVRSLARLWDRRFSDIKLTADANAWAAKWGQTLAFDIKRVRAGEQPEGPILPDHPTARDVADAMGCKPVENPDEQFPLNEVPSRWVTRQTLDGVAQIRWHRNEWIDLPTMGELDEMVVDSVCPTPDGQDVEPDHQFSWLSVLGLI